LPFPSLGSRGLNRIKALVRCIVDKLRSRDPRLVSSTLFLVLYTERVDNVVVLNPIERDARKALEFELVEGIPVSRAVSRLVEEEIDGCYEIGDPHLEKRLKDAIDLVKRIELDGVKNIVEQLFGYVPGAIPVEELAMEVRTVREEVNNLLNSLKLEALGEVNGEAEAF